MVVGDRPVPVNINRKALRERSMGYCEVGGEPLGDRWAVHHRKLRKHGGDNRLSNLLIVCHDHHNLATRSIHLRPATAYANGWLVESSKEPGEVLVKIYGQHWALLTDDGRYDQNAVLEQARARLVGT